MRISDWSSDVCSSDLGRRQQAAMSWSKMLSYIPEPVANSPQAQPWVNQAREAVNANQSELHAFLSQRVDLASHAGTATGRELERFEHCLDKIGRAHV